MYYTSAFVMIVSLVLSTVILLLGQKLARLLWIYFLACRYDEKYAELGELEDLNKALGYWGQAAALAQNDPDVLSSFGVSLHNRFERLGELADLDNAIDYQSQAVLLTRQGDSDMPARLWGLAISLRTRFQRLGEFSDLDKAVDYFHQAVLLTPNGDPDMPSMLNNLGVILEIRFEQLGELTDLNEAIEHLGQAISLIHQEGSDMPAWLSNLGSSLEARFERLGELSDLEKAIDHLSQAVSLTSQEHSEMPSRLNNLGISLKTRFDRLGELSDLEIAIEHQNSAVSLAPQGHPALPAWLNNLGSSLELRFRRLGELTDLEKAIEHKSLAVLLTPQGHSNMPTLLSNLGTSFESRFQRRGELVDLDKAIEHEHQAVLLTPQGYSKMPGRLSQLGGSLKSRFMRLGEISDLDKAIEYLGQAVLLTPQDDSHILGWLNNLGVLLETRFRQLGDLADLDKAIDHISQAVLLTPQEHLDISGRLNNLATSLAARFDRLGELSDLEKAIEHQSSAVLVIPQEHPNMPGFLINLGDLFESRFQRQVELADLDKAIGHKNLAVSLTPSGHSSMPSRLNSLGHAYRTRSDRLGLAEDINASLDCFQNAAEYSAGSPFERFSPAFAWASMCAKHRPSSLLKAYGLAMSLLPQLAWVGNAVDNRYRYISDLGSVTTEAATAAIRMKDYYLALEWLEEGRSIVWRQMLRLRTPVDELAAVSPELASELRQVAQDLDHASSPRLKYETVSVDDLSLEQVAQQHRRLAERWEELLIEARRLPGFETFLCPLKASELICSARSGPVVIIILEEGSCDALVIQPGLVEILHVPLGFSYEKAEKTRIQLDQLVRSCKLTQRYLKLSKREPKDTFENALTTLWTEVVKPVLAALNYMQTPPDGELPHITWCTTGPLSFLPLHAAGDYESASAVFDYVISSYAPTMSRLLSTPSPATFSGLLAVGQSSTSGLPPLPGTAIELTRIQERFQGHKVTLLDGDQAVPAAVLSGMEEHSWVHLACHAMQDTANPMQSAFYLHGGTLDLATVTQKQLKHADFAFLSACQTATGDESLSDEAVHLAAGMLMVGYQGVIATMWSIGDADAPLVAEAVYEYLLEGRRPDARRAAVALHKATEKLREKVGMKAFSKWVPYVHIGQ